MDSTGAVTRAVSWFAGRYLAPGAPVCVALSGGPDSLALTAAAVRAGLDVHALVVDHRLQVGSDHVAAQAAATAQSLGATAAVLAVDVTGAGGVEAAARDARYGALDGARAGRPVLLGHTADDQAETVLLGLARGSGARSIAGMRPWRDPWGRPFLGLRRAVTVAACRDFDVQPHADPHNSDPRFTRVRLRTEVMPLLDEVLHGGVVEALARTAHAVGADSDALDGIADGMAGEAISEAGLSIDAIREAPASLRTRVVRRWLLAVGATEPTARLIDAVDGLVTGVSSGRVAIGGDSARRTTVRVSDGLLVLGTEPR